VILSRTFTVIAACLLVASFALLVLPPDGMSLAQGLSALGHDLPAFREFVVATMGSGVWLHVFVPLLVRPVWLLPLSLGLIAAGVAASTLPLAESPRRTGRRL